MMKIPRFWLSAALVLALGTQIGAEKLYKTTDENGTPFFSNVQPGGDGPVEVEQVYVEHVPDWVTVRNDEPGAVHFRNRYHGPAQVEVQAVESANVATEPPLPARFVLSALEEAVGFRFTLVDASRPWSFRYRYEYVPGPPGGGHHPPENGYRLPFPRGESHVVGQAFHGTFSHQEAHSAYAVDLSLPEGTAVHAARSGVVMEVARDFFTAGDDALRFGPRANRVRVLHDDGTMAIYAHLELESLRVRMGQRVRPGDRLASSGNTGYSTGPHLHFAVQQNTGMEVVSVPFRFRAGEGRLVTPEQGQVLSH